MSIEAKISSVETVLEKNLAIPPYQRPYRWTKTNVMQLLADVHESMISGKREYRIGTVIYHLHNENGTSVLDIVDGQQRLTTILIALRELSKEDKHVNCMKNLSYKNNSVATILENRGFIMEWVKDNIPNEKTEFAKYLLEKCKFVEISVDNLGEAFQMFDTQNGRGKSLEAYNLLKAYHIRAMEQNSQEERIQCDRNWESATQYDATPEIPNDPNIDILAQLFGEQLYKIRLWCRSENAKPFSRDGIEEFKGFTIDKNHPIAYPFQNPFLLQYLTEKFYRNVLAGTIGSKSRLESGESEKTNPFVNINQEIINGKSFFEYIETYVEMYKKMFIELGSYQLSEFKRFFYLHCLTYTGEDQEKSEEVWNAARLNSNAFRHHEGCAGRTGDTYLREVYKSLCFVLLDKFGEKVFLRYYKVLYQLVYMIRIRLASVRLKTAMSVPTKYFVIIHRAKNETGLLELSNELLRARKEHFEHTDKLPPCLSIFVQKGITNE